MIVILIVSGVFLLFGLSFLRLQLNFRVKGKVLPATIYGIERYQSRTNRKTSTFYRPIVKYSFNGEDYIFTSGFGTNDITWDIGQRVQVYSLDKGPEYVRLKSKAHLILPFIFALFGALGSGFYFFKNPSFVLMGFYFSLLVLIPSFIYQYLKSKLLLDKFLDSLLKVKIETGDSFQGREVFLERSELEKHASKNDRVAFIITSLFALGTSTGLHFSWKNTKATSKEYFYDLLRNYERINELEVFIKDKSFLLSLILIFFTGMLAYSLLYQVLRSRRS